MMAEKPVRRLMDETASYLSKGIERGILEESPSEAMVSSLQESAGVFSGFKTFHEMKEAANLLLDENGNLKPFERFSNDVQKINDAYNKHYLQTEYNFAVQSAQMAARWEEQQDDGGGRYLLQYRTAGDSKVRESHRKMDGITLPPSDPFWDKYYPPNGFNCFPAGTPILMGDGSFKAIEEIKKGDLVIGGSGQRKPVIGTHIRAYNGEMTRVITEGGTVSCTPNHRFLTARGWIAAGELEVGDILIQVGKVGTFDIAVNAIHNAHAIIRNGFMSFVRKWHPVRALAVDNKVKSGQKEVHDITPDHLPELERDSLGDKKVKHDLLAWAWWKAQCRKILRMQPPCTDRACNSPLPNVGTKEGRTCLQLLGDLANHPAIRLGLSLSNMLPGKSKLMVGSGKAFACGITPFSIANPLRDHGFSPSARLKPTMQDKFGDASVVDTPQGTEAAVTPKISEVSEFHGIPDIHSFNGFNSFYDFIRQTFLHTRYILVKGKDNENISMSVYNLSVKEDESYVLPSGIVHNCRCTVAKVRAAKYPATDSAEAMKAGDEATAGKYAEMFRFNPGKQRAAYPAYNSYTISKCKTCRKNGLDLAKIPSNELCAACKVIREEIQQGKYERDAEFGDRLLVALEADKTELDENKRAAKALLRSFPEMRITIRKHSRVKGEKNAEYLIDDIIADRKGIKSPKGIQSGFKKAIEQECNAVVVDLDANMSDKKLPVSELAKYINWRKSDFESGRIVRCYVVYHNKAIVITPNHKDREAIKAEIEKLKP